MKINALILVALLFIGIGKLTAQTNEEEAIATYKLAQKEVENRSYVDALTLLDKVDELSPEAKTRTSYLRVKCFKGIYNYEKYVYSIHEKDDYSYYLGVPDYPSYLKKCLECIKYYFDNGKDEAKKNDLLKLKIEIENCSDYREMKKVEAMSFDELASYVKELSSQITESDLSNTGTKLYDIYFTKPGVLQYAFTKPYQDRPHFIVRTLYLPFFSINNDAKTFEISYREGALQSAFTIYENNNLVNWKSDLDNFRIGKNSSHGLTHDDNDQNYLYGFFGKEHYTKYDNSNWGGILSELWCSGCHKDMSEVTMKFILAFRVMIEKSAPLTDTKIETVIYDRVLPPYDGAGVEVLPNGERYDGTWKKGQRNGKFTCTQPDGTVWDGEYKKGELKGEWKRR